MLKTLKKAENQYIFRSFFIGLIFSILTKVISFIYTVIITKELSLNDYGIFRWLTTLLSYVTLIINMGFSIYFQTLLSENLYYIDKLISLQIFYRFTVSIFILILLAIFNILIESKFCKVAFLLSLHLVAHTIDFSWLLNFNNKSQINNIGEFIQTLFVLLIISIFYIIEKVELSIVAITFSVSTFINFISKIFLANDLRIHNYLIIILKHFKFYIKWCKSNLLVILKKSFIVNLSFIMITVYYNIDNLMIGIFRSKEEVAKYSIAYNYLLLSIIPTGIMYQSFQRYLLDNKLTKKAYIKYITCTTTLGLVIFLLLIIFHRPLILIPFGEKYIESVKILFWLSFDIIPCYLAGALANPINLYGYHKQYLLIVSSGAVFNVIGNFILIPIYGVYGAIFTTIFSEIIVAIGSGLFLINNRNQLWRDK